MPVLRNVILGGCLLAALPGVAEAQSAIPTRPTTVDEWLKNEFQDVLGSCSITLTSTPTSAERTERTERRGRRNADQAPAPQPLAFVPPAISAELERHLGKNVTYFDGTLTTLFGRVWSREGDVGIALSLDYANLADRVVVSGRNNVTFSHNCLTTLQAAADAQVNLSVAQLKGALSAAFDTNRTFGTSFVYGSFRSPIARDLSLVTREVGARIDEAGTAMHLWGWYRANPQFVGQELYIIGDLHGIARYRFREVKLETRADGSASGRGGLLVFSAGGEVEGALRATTTTSGPTLKFSRGPTAKRTL